MIIVLFRKIVVIKNEPDVRLLKSVVNEQCGNIKMGVLNKTKLITASSELVNNMLKYGRGGEVLIETVAESTRQGIRITFTDQGPGIVDLSLVMQDGYSTANTLGIGLPGARRLADEFAIKSEVNKGTTVIITKWENG